VCVTLVHESMAHVLQRCYIHIYGNRSNIHSVDIGESKTHKPELSLLESPLAYDICQPFQNIN